MTEKIQAYTVMTALILFVCCSTAFSQQTADANANQTTRCILQYFSNLPSQSSHKLISGQWMHFRGSPETPLSEFDTAITSIYNLSSHWVGAIGTNYLREIIWPAYDITNHITVNKPLIDYFKQGGLIHVMVSWKNPWNGGNSNNTGGATNLTDIITSGRPANIAFMQALDSVALGFQQLQDSGVTVIFRPLHEMNGVWFWWGNTPTRTPNDFISVWRFIFHYMTNTKKLHNILWMYSPSAKETGTGAGLKPELYFYPGDSLVDIIGLDVYNDTLDIPNYNSLVAVGKPLGLAEFGPRKATVTDLNNVYDYTTLLNQIKTKYPKLCFWNSYNHFNNGTHWIYYSLSTQNSSRMLNDAWIANRDEIDYSKCLTTGLNENNFQNISFYLFPNPFSTQTVIQSELVLNNAKITIFNSLGQPVSELKNISGQTINLCRDNLPSGCYYLWITQDNKRLASTKIILTD